jgi:uncharacterized membrane protein YhaH (DUF805 family)
VFCSKCGAKNDESAIFCAKCGGGFIENPDSAQFVKPEQSARFEQRAQSENDSRAKQSDRQENARKSSDGEQVFKNPWKAYPEFWEKRLDFKSESGRFEFWSAWMLNSVFYSALLLIVFSYSAIFAGHTADWLVLFFNLLVISALLALLIPSIAISVRRLHDIGLHGLWLLLAPTGIGLIILIILFCLPSGYFIRKPL